MFLKEEDLPQTIYGYQLDQITEGNDDIISIALAAAEEEMRSYLTGNNMRHWQDGRLHYDVEAIFAQRGETRNPLLVKHGVTIAKWWIVDLSNVDILYEQVKERYDRAVAWLTKLAKGEINLSTLPQLDPEDDPNYDDPNKPFVYGSRKKFNHE